MPTVEPKTEAFAVWITGLPAAGKSTVAGALERQLAERGIDVAVLESDVLRKVFASDKAYTPEGRDTFYKQMLFVGSLLLQHGVSVIFDATANRRAYRDRARQELARFVEVYLDVPLETCMARDPKGLYRSGNAGEANHVPGLQDPYEAPESPDVVIHGDDPEADARRIIEKLADKQYLPRRRFW